MSSEPERAPLSPWPEEPNQRSGPEPGPTPLEWKVPLLLLVLGVAVIVGAALGLPELGLAELRGAAEVLLEVALRLAVGLPVTIAALFLVAAVLGITFGPLNSAVLKLASISVFSNALVLVGMLLGQPLIGWLVALVVSWYLFSLFFDLDLQETAVSIVLLGLIQYGVVLMVGALL
jgi:hypothetical protein